MTLFTTREKAIFFSKGISTSPREEGRDVVIYQRLENLAVSN